MDAAVTHMICVLGDAHLDVIVSLAGPVEPETDTPAATSVGAGGQAANVAAWITALGGRGVGFRLDRAGQRDDHVEVRVPQNADHARDRGIHAPLRTLPS